MAKDEYIFAVARVKAMENELLKKQDIDSLISATNMDGVQRILVDKGLIQNETEMNNFVEVQNNKLWSFISELTQDKGAFVTIKLKNDFHNAKVAIKSEYMGQDNENLYEQDSIIPYKEIETAIKTKTFSNLPAFIAPYVEKAYEILFKTNDPQLSDSILDKGQLFAMNEFAQNNGSDVLIDYAKTQATIADIKIAVRGAKTKKDQSFFDNALSGVSEFNLNQLSNIASQGEDSLYSFLENSGYTETVDLLKDDFLRFETWADNKIMEDIEKQKYVFTTISPIIAYILARQNEIKNVNIIIASKKNGINEEDIRKMVTKSYV